MAKRRSRFISARRSPVEGTGRVMIQKQKDGGKEEEEEEVRNTCTRDTRIRPWPALYELERESGSGDGFE